MEIWFKKLGFYNNPFSIKPAAFSDELFGYNVQDIMDKINNGEVLFIEGAYGKGKTTILKKIIRQFGGKKRVVYYSCNRKEDEIDLEEILKGRYGFFGRMFNIKPKDMILLLDESQYMNEKDSENLAYYYNDHYFRAIVLVSHDFFSIKMSDGLKKLVNGNVIKLNKLNPEDSVSLIRKRIGDVDIIDDETIKLIFSKSDENPRRLLKNSELVFKHAFDRGYEKVTKEHVEAVLK